MPYFIFEGYARSFCPVGLKAKSVIALPIVTSFRLDGLSSKVLADFFGTLEYVRL